MKESLAVDRKPFRINKHDILVVLTLGLLTIATQIILLREILSIFYGNELVIGIILANWMLLTALGSYLGRVTDRFILHISSALYILIILTIIPLVLVFLMYYLRNIVFVPGTMVNLLQIFLSTFVLLIPFCIPSGFTFTLLSSIISRDYKKNLISKAYFWE